MILVKLNMNPRLPQIVSLALALTAKSALDPSQLLNSLVEADGGYQFVDRGQNFAVLRKITAASDANGGTTLTTNDVTLLENDLHYLANGKWEPSRDVLEPFPGGAVGRFGPNKTVFSPDLNAEAVFDIETPDGPLMVRYRRAVLCPGARELFLPFPGWTLPGVSGAGGLQALMKGGLPVAGKRVVIAGSGPLLLAVAQSLKRAGANIVLLADQAPASQIRRFALSLWRYPGKALQALTLAPQALRLQHDTWVLRAEGRQHLEQVVVTRRGRQETIACDHLACGFGLIPNTELPALFGCRIDQGRAVVDQMLRTNRPDVLCAGEVLGIGGVDAALIEGRLAGHVAADQLTHAGALLPSACNRSYASISRRRARDSVVPTECSESSSAEAISG